ncbi:MAG: hypothetical protein KW804_00425 [Candidatus Doudnabacteria bacterium]|nr:hypothetical protein [Candidatus Doudnabacteria bacterium]
MKKILIGFGIIVVITGLTLWYLQSDLYQDSKRGPKPQSTSESSFLLNEMGYECSKKIDGRWVEAYVGNPGSPGYYFQPTNQEDLQKYCRTTSIIEYRAVLDILRKEDVGRTIEKYSTAEAWVRALGHKYIHDKDYLNRILPAYSSMKIDCIIVVHTPESTRFFIENGEKHDSHNDHQYLEVSATEFLSSLNNASDEDVNNFWLALH